VTKMALPGDMVVLVSPGYRPQGAGWTLSPNSVAWWRIQPAAEMYGDDAIVLRRDGDGFQEPGDEHAATPAPKPVDHRPLKRSACCDEALDEHGHCLYCTPEEP